MIRLRALLGFAWLLLSLTATFTLPTAAAPKTENTMPCHMEGMDMTPHHRPDAPPLPQSVMPCCSQPVLAPEAGPIAPHARPSEMAYLVPPPARPMTSLPARLEPRPPKMI